MNIKIKHTIAFLGVLLTSLGIIYLITAFIAGDLNPMNWNWTFRAIIIVPVSYIIIKLTSYWVKNVF